MPTARADVERMLARCEASWSPEVERWVAAAEGGVDRLLPAAQGLLRASWNDGGRAAAVAAVALLESALDTGARDHPQRPRWVLDLWLAERTLSLRHDDFRLSRDIHHHLGAQTQGRSADDPVAVAAVYPMEPLPRYGEPVRPVEHGAVRLANALPPDDAARRSLLLRLAQAALFRFESGDAAALPDAWDRGRAAYDGLTVDHVEAWTVASTAAAVSAVWFRAHQDDRSAAELGVRAAQSALDAIAHRRDHGATSVGYESGLAHFAMAQALLGAASWDLRGETMDAVVGHLDAFRADGPPDDGGTYAVNMASALAARAFVTGSRDDIARAGTLLADLERDLGPGHPMLPHIAQKRAACAEMPRLMRMLPFKTVGLMRKLRPHLGALMVPTALPPVQVFAPLPSPGYTSPGPGPEDVRARFGGAGGGAGVGGAAVPGPRSNGAAPAQGVRWTWPPAPGPAPEAGLPQPADLTGLPPEAAAVLGALTGKSGTPLDPRQLEAAESQLRARLAEPGLDEGRRGWTANVLVLVLSAGFVSERDVDSLEKAVHAGDEALATLSPSGSRYLGLLCTVEEQRLVLGTFVEDEATVVRAGDALRWALDRAPGSSNLWVQCASLRGMALAQIGVRRRDPAASQEANRLLAEASRLTDALAREAAPFPETAAEVARMRVYVDRAAAMVKASDEELRMDRYGLEETELPWDRAAEAGLPTAARFHNARAAMGTAMERRDWAGATDAAEAALEVLPLLTSRALDRGDRQNALRSALLGGRYPAPSGPGGRRELPDQLAGTSLGRTGCAAALAMGAVDRAAVLLEQGRAVLMNQDLEARADLTDLAAADPDLAARFAAAAERLSRAEEAAADPGGHRGPSRPVYGSGAGHGQESGAGHEQRIREQHEAAGRWRRLLDEIRARPDCTGFLLPPTAEAIRAEADEGPIVLINVDRLRCDALVVTTGAITLVPLEGISEGLVARKAQDFLAAVAVDDLFGDEAAAARETVFGTLEWLWDEVAEPVLRAAGLAEPVPRETPWQQYPRLWWSASGPLAHLPLHAAGYQRKGRLGERRSVLDRVASSYTPSIRALRHARQASAPRPDGGPYLAVGQPTGEGGAEGASTEEIALVARKLGGATVLDGDRAAVAAVLSALPPAATVHFACHGVSDPADPSRSRLDLADGPLAVTAVSRLRLRHAQLAVLLACHTARTDRLPDEAIHLTSAFQTAGYPQVVGALWEAADLVSRRFADDLYRALRRYGGGLDLSLAARAVNANVRELRAVYSSAPAAWAAYIHTGR
ncbi:CHAT domain-containing protein [Streptomyces sp. NPDC049040]|uniref:CHAT domain-containing protein n=1 Tax=Streptomyces sp. NPDC049040 TaxID=3365593 RepID=UPI0037217BC3